MFGFDKMFDFNRDGKLESWERAAQFQFMDEMMKDDEKNIFDDDDEIDTFADAGLDYDELEFMDPDERREVLEEAGLEYWMSLIFKRRIQRMKSNIEMKMDLMERRQAVHANKIQALMLMITAMQIPEKDKNRKILKAVRVSTALLWLLTCVEDVVLMTRKNYN